MQYINKAHDLLQDYIKPQGVKILSLIGFLFLASKTLSILPRFRRTFLPFAHNLSQRYGPGSWALITGGAQGIGAAFAAELASKGFNLILIDQNAEKLTQTQTTINMKHPNIQIKTITINFSDSWKEGFYDSLMEQLQGFDISVLVNNVGTGTPAGPFHEMAEDRIRNTITVNIVPMTILCRRLIPVMLKRPHRSGIINIASMTGVYVTPWIADYSGTKAYVDFFTRAIEKDVKEKIDVLSVRPGAVSTAMIRMPKVGTYVASPEHVASSCLRKLGNTTVTFGAGKHEVMGWIETLPGMSGYWARNFYRNTMGRTNYKY